MGASPDHPGRWEDPEFHGIDMLLTISCVESGGFELITDKLGRRQRLEAVPRSCTTFLEGVHLPLALIRIE